MRWRLAGAPLPRFPHNIAIGGGANASLSRRVRIAVGSKTRIAESRARPWGTVRAPKSPGALALGGDAQVSGDGSVGVGQGLRVANRYATAVGASATVELDGGVAIGAYSICDRDQFVSVGNNAASRYIGHVLAGRHDDEVVTVGQLKDAGLLVNAEGGLDNTLVAFSDRGRGRVALPSAQVSGLRQGEISARSTDAVMQAPSCSGWSSGWRLSRRASRRWNARRAARSAARSAALQTRSSSSLFHQASSRGWKRLSGAGGMRVLLRAGGSSRPVSW